MTNKKTTRRALLTSMLSLLLCLSMLIGTTFAWFTDSVESGTNVIAAGNLDIELYNSIGIDESKKVSKNTPLFEEITYWEPGVVAYENLTVANMGTLALKYQLAVNFTNEVKVNGHGLSEALKVAVVENGFTGTREDAMKLDGYVSLKDLSKSGELLNKNDSKTWGIVIWWQPTDNDNWFNMNNENQGKKLTIDLGVKLFATQLTSEQDSFGSDYDKDAAWAGEAKLDWYGDGTASEYTLLSASDLAGLAQIVNSGKDSFVGKTVKLGADIDLNGDEGVLWTPIGTETNKFNGTFIGTGYTIYNLKAVGTTGVGLFGYTSSSTHIEGVTINGAYVSGNDYVGTVLGSGYLSANCLKNCTVTGATIMATPYQKADGTYDGGAKAGVIVGYANNGHLTGNTAKDSTVIAYRDLGGIAGMASGENYAMNVSGNTVENVTLSYVGVAGKYDGNKVNGNMNEVVGRPSNVVDADNINTLNTVTNVTKNEDNKGAIMIFTYDELVAFAADVNGGTTYQGKTVILGADIDLMNAEWTPIGTGDGFKGTFDGNGHIISNLKITGNKSTVGLFANTYNGEIKNLTVENASVSGYLNVGVVAGNPYTSKYTNITVKGHVEVNGFAYVGGVGGKNAYANWTNVTVDVDETSYVKAISTEDGKAYRTYVGGVVGFNGEGGHTFKNITSNIDVIGDVCDIGGAFGIAHYGNNFENITVTGNVTSLGEADEIGGIAGVWNNATGYTVSFTNCKFTGKITAADGDVTGCDLVGGAYSSTGTGVLNVVNYSEVDGMTLATYPLTGEVVLSKVSSNAPATLKIPEGVTALGSKILNGNTTVKEVVIPSTVTSFGGTPNATGTGASGGMFYNSAVEKVVLPEGMKEIPVAAFNQATKLKEVNIPSSVTSIGINAFAGSALNNLTIPATVETIGYGAFRDMLSLTTATIEGDVYVPSYAFRNCASLKSVYLNGTNVSFGDNMIFTVTSTNNENPNGITVYVKNDGIKARLEATGQFKGTIVSETPADANGIYTDSNGDKFAYAADTTEMTSAISNGAATVFVGNGTYVVPSNVSGKTVTIAGNGETVIDITTVPTYAGLPGATIVFEDVVIKSDPQGAGYDRGFAHTNKITYNNCVINGTLGLNTDTEFNNCTFNISGDYYSLWTWGAENVTINGCTFNSDGKALLLYGTSNTKLTVNNCVFNDNGGLTAKKAAIEIGNDYGKSYELIVTNTTVNGYEINDAGINTNSTLWANKNSMPQDKLNVVVDGVDVY